MNQPTSVELIGVRWRDSTPHMVSYVSNGWLDDTISQIPDIDHLSIINGWVTGG